MALVAAKKELRKEIRRVLELLSAEEISKQSAAVTKHVVSSKEFQDSQSVCVFLHMPGRELSTEGILEAIFKAGKRCFVPRVLSKESMAFFEAFSMEDVQAFPRNSWSIPEPPTNRPKALDCGGLDLVLMPGVAFDRHGRRCGHGRGYYDRHLKLLAAASEAAGKPPPVLMALALKEQVVDEVPTGDQDVPLHQVITPDGPLL